MSLRRISPDRTLTRILNPDQNSRYDGDAQEDEPAEAKFSDDEEEAKYRREHRVSATTGNAQVTFQDLSFSL